MAGAIRRLSGVFILLAIGMAGVGAAQTTQPTTTDAGPQKTLYVVGYAHLDTQWRWTYPQVIRDFLANTMRKNFPLLEKYPHYIFNFTGARRYALMKEYFPADYETMKKYIAAGRWFPCGSSVDENDTDMPSAESLVRQVLYGNEYFRHEFGVESCEYMLPDSFGFTGALPEILAHCGIRGFSTQKLTWGSAVGIPFKVGRWLGPDGTGVIAALDPGPYTGTLALDLANSPVWMKRIMQTGEACGAYVDYHYYGTGDRGGAPAETSVAYLEKKSATEGQMKIRSSTAQQMFLDISDAQREKLPVYQGELLLTQHSTGSLSSQAAMKRWNRKNELLADAAERASVAAAWLGGQAYPAKTLHDAWFLVLGSQMHDMMAGTAMPKAFEYCWNDELLAANQFSAVATDAVGAVAAGMDTRAQGAAVVAYNPLSIDREDVVDAKVDLLGQDATAVFSPDGQQVPSQVLERGDGWVRLSFVAKVPANGMAVYDVRSARSETASMELKVDEKGLENSHYRVTLNEAGDIASVWDKVNNREVLSGPARLAFLTERPQKYPAWNMDWADRQKPPRAYVTGPAAVRVVESGPVRVTLEVDRQAEGSRFVQRISLAAGETGDRVEVANRVDWQTPTSSLKAVFPLAATNAKATYDIQVGTMSRGNNDEKKYEVPQHQWLDVTDAGGGFGTAVLNDCKFGSDKPDDQTVRLTLLYSPGVRTQFQDQATQDFGRHEFVYALMPHAGDWRQGGVAWAAARLNQPLMPFQARPHEGALGKTFSLMKVSSGHVAIEAIKKAEESDEIIVRLREMTGQPADGVRLSAAVPIAAAREVNGQEKAMEGGAADLLQDGGLVTKMAGYGLRAFALKLAPAPKAVSMRRAQSIALAYDMDAVSSTAAPADGAFDAQGRTYPAEALPAKITFDGVDFEMGPTDDGKPNAVACRGQTIAVPEGFNRVYVLAAADGDRAAVFKVGQAEVKETIQDWSGYIGQWDNRLWKGNVAEFPYAWPAEYDGLIRGYVKLAPVAWYCSHRHLPKEGNAFYEYCYLFRYALDMPAGVRSLTFPADDKIKIFAMTATDGRDVRPARELFDRLRDHEGSSTPIISPMGGTFSAAATVTLTRPLYWDGGAIHYTLDGTEPTAQSPAYEKPIVLEKSANIRVRDFNRKGEAFQTSTAQFVVQPAAATQQ